MQAQVAPVTPQSPQFEEAAAACGEGWVRLPRLAVQVPRVPCGAQGPLHVPSTALPRWAAALPPPDPAWTPQELRGALPELFSRGGFASGRRRFIFTVGFCGATWARFLSQPLGERVPGPSSAGVRAPGKRPRKETFPSLIVLPLAERVMKILGKCYTTRG